MKKLAIASLLTAQTALAVSALAQQAPIPVALQVAVTGIADGQPISAKFAYCVPDSAKHTTNGGNISPAISWSGGTSGIKSYAIIVSDPDVPSSFDLANKSDKILPADFPRRVFYHWVLADIPTTVSSIAEGKNSQGVAPKTAGATDYGINGQNDYPDGGYDGPCPPWNDERLHHYYFTVYALDVPSLGLTGNFTGKQAEDAMSGHVLARGEVVGTYTQNPGLLK